MIAVSVHKRQAPAFPLKELLRSRARTQYSLAKQTRLSTTYLSRIATGKVEPGWKIVCIIAEALGASLGDFHPPQFPAAPQVYPPPFVW
jgi:transcriptional regulator with XRE-family HTH domain